MNHRSNTADPATPDVDPIVPTAYGRLDIWIDGTPTPAYVKFCTTCWCLVAAVKMTAHTERHRKGMD